MEASFPKCPVCGQSSGYVVSGVFRNYVQCQYCQAKWRLFFSQSRQLTGLLLHELPKNGQALWRVQSLGAPLFTVLGREYPVDFWSKLALASGVDWDYMSRCVPAAVASAAIMGKGEKTLYCWSGLKAVLQLRTVGGQSSYANVDQGGTLLLTNRRLLWLEQHVTTRRSGFFSSTTEASWLVKSEIVLDGIKGITGSSGDSQSWASPSEIHIVDAAGEHTFKLYYGFWEVFKPAVEAAVVLRQDEVEREKRQDKVHVMLDFSFLRKYMEDGGMVVQNLKCPECGASVKFPDAGSQSVCSHCGANIYANDVFKKIKDLIG
jgi:ribosomal protein S27AE